MRVVHDGRDAALHARCWAAHVTVTNPEHVRPAGELRQQHRPVQAQQAQGARRSAQSASRQHEDGHPVMLRALPDYDFLFGSHFDPLGAAETGTGAAARFDGQEELR